MALNALPAELTLYIAGYLDPDTTLDFALTCKRHTTLCKSLLQEHRRLLSEWQTIDTKKAQTLTWQVLLEILDDPSRGWYVRELSLPGTRQQDWSRPQPHNWTHLQSGIRVDFPAPCAEEKKIMKKAARKLGDLYPVLQSGHVLARDPSPPLLQRPNDIVGTIEDRIDQSNDDGVIAILLHYLPNLKTIRFTEHDDSDCFELMVHRIAGAYQEPCKAARLPLRHLTTAAISYGRSDECTTPLWASAFLSIPSLRTFAVYEMGGGYAKTRNGYLRPVALSISNVTELYFKNCLFDYEALDTLLAGVKHLKKFTLDGRDLDTLQSYDENKRLIPALVARVGQSLEELVLDFPTAEEEDESSEQTLPVSFRDFRNLRMLNCGWAMVRPIPDDEPEDDEPLEQGFHRKEDHQDLDTDFDVRTLLPQSLERLYLNGYFGSNDGDYEWRAIERVFANTSTATPRLTMENTCIQHIWNSEARAQIGTAEPPPGRYFHPFLLSLFDGHAWGYD
ncbi:hypothetical protein HBI56_207390 [Parastagonospora nodorum]|uniref:F-box domain-containing protein n=1 Tax=Phaeosphaeria nodorum (strain SN15 / ATCC MYA-4574 / FGSC 10173) TaxID=321614 RepID=A0A7U2NP70_PHANO|nr:hypothetical protein HBH56_217630 [Parastagonospora nodorum]QRD05461.1 hypothetical protein JI435_154610 [Parastagonospora nodorum SN15]KAH3922779.1 hypothetical protein HBH54_219490 [Parastagonospora nodorum]KAH3941183.1 hypothetical protein HBH53_206100 [Parastagonospora nodorum]KAH3958144.1 hypothetical protein HBH51_214390 [Parastagonospora nodorum]